MFFFFCVFVSASAFFLNKQITKKSLGVQYRTKRNEEKNKTKKLATRNPLKI
jgi:hypothetical protein